VCSDISVSPLEGEADTEVFAIKLSCHDGYGISHTLAYTYEIEYISQEGQLIPAVDVLASNSASSELLTTLFGYGNSLIKLNVENGLGKSSQFSVNVFLFKYPVCTGIALTPLDGESGVEVFDISALGCEDGYGRGDTLTYEFSILAYADFNAEVDNNF